MLLLCPEREKERGARASELCPPERTGTALTLHTSLGFLLNLATIRLVPVLERLLTWPWAFAALALGPAFGLWAMSRLKSGSRLHIPLFGRKKRLASGRKR